METKTSEATAAAKPVVGRNIPTGKYNEQRWLVAHNAWNTNQNPWNNQDKTITELLDYGVRGFALDIYGDDKNSLHLQHGHGNVATAIDWIVIRDEIKAWMDVHPNEIVSLFFENYLTGPGNGNTETTALETLNESLSEIPYYLSGKEAQTDALSDKTLKELVTDGHRLFAFLEKEPDEGRQSLFPVMQSLIAENVYGDESLEENKWCNVREHSSSYSKYKFMNHFGNAPTDSSTDRNKKSRLVRHAEDFVFHFHGHYPNFISLDKINCEGDEDNGSDLAIKELIGRQDMDGVTKFKWRKVSTFDSVNTHFDEAPIIGLNVKTAKGQGITEINAMRSAKGDPVSEVELINVPGHGIVNMRYKTAGGKWSVWLTEFEESADDDNTALHVVPQGKTMLGYCCRTSTGYGVVDFALAYR